MKKFLTILTIILALFFVGSTNLQAQNDKSAAKPNDKPLKIKPPFPNASAWACNGEYAEVLLRVTFKADGKIGDVEIVKNSGCKAFTKSAIAAARKLKFEPAEKDGKPFDVKKTIEYKVG